MGTKSVKPLTTSSDADPDFMLSPTLRRPAEALGPRANRTIASILEATKEIFLVRGYAGTTIDEIARLAGVSRASFYTYYPSKRDVLLALGANTASNLAEMVEELASMKSPCSQDIEQWMKRHFARLDEDGSFAFAWTQAAHEDEEIRLAGMKRHLEICRRFGEVMGELRGEPFASPTEQGLAVLAMVERSWSYCQLYSGTINEESVRAGAAWVLASMVAPVEH
ncbi:MAG: transcriptional regulator, TetR family [Acidimicrobiia bacterium]|nr:transcriptional regulator, TetR family [Acidimicrobiia bacterium]